MIEIYLKTRQFNELNDNKKASQSIDFAKMRVGLTKIDDAMVDLSAFETVKTNYTDKHFINRAIETNDLTLLSKISDYYYRANGIYQRTCNYLAQLYKYDWYITPFLVEGKTINEPKVLSDFAKALLYFDNSNIKKLFGRIALEVIIKGSYYGIKCDADESFYIQELPSKYCRTRFYIKDSPVVELNMRFFDDLFPIAQQRIEILKAFPKDVQKGYIKYKEGKLPIQYPGDSNGWYTLEVGSAIKISLNNKDTPPLIGAIPSLIDLNLAQDLDRRKTMQQLLKIIIQKLPLDKNGELIFDVDEAKDIHINAVQMLKRAVGVDVLTTFADVDIVDMADQNSATTKDDLEKVERTVFNNLGISQNLFNTDGNMALEKSIANDEATVRDLVYQFQILLNDVIKRFDKKNYFFKANILNTTIYNYKDVSKLYKEQVQLGFSKILPQIALGHSQSDIIASITFENKILRLSDIMIPPNSSFTTSSVSKNENNTGRPEKPDDEKSDKTIQNKEAMG